MPPAHHHEEPAHLTLCTSADKHNTTQHYRHEGCPKHAWRQGRSSAASACSCGCRGADGTESASLHKHMGTS